MKSADGIKRFFKNATVSTNKKADDAIVEQLTQAHKEATSLESTKPEPNTWRIIMHSKITKLATAAAVILIVSLVTTIFVTSTPLAYALDDTIEANHSVRFLHVKDFSHDQNEPKEFWVQCSPNGEIDAARAQFPAWVSPSDGAKAIVWKQGIVQVYLNKKNFLLIANDQATAKQTLAMVQQIDPRLLVESAKQHAELGMVDIETRTPSNKSDPIVVTVTYVRESDNKHRKILLVDQATKLVTVIESYRLQNGEYIHTGTMELYDYNIPIAADMFTLENEVPKDVTVFDQTKMIGLAQTGMTDEEVAVEVVKQFFEAIIAEDFKKAGSLMEGAPPKFFKQALVKDNTKFLRVISVGPAGPHPTPATKGLLVPCNLEVEKDGQRITYEAKLGVRQVFNQPGRWTIFGGSF